MSETRNVFSACPCVRFSIHTRVWNKLERARIVLDSGFVPGLVALLSSCHFSCRIVVQFWRTLCSKFGGKCNNFQQSKIKRERAKVIASARTQIFKFNLNFFLSFLLPSLVRFSTFPRLAIFIFLPLPCRFYVRIFASSICSNQTQNLNSRLIHYITRTQNETFRCISTFN